MRKYEGKSNVAGELIEKAIREKNMTKEELCKKLQLVGLNIDRWHLYKIINGKVILKDFELIIICNILNLDMNELKKLIQPEKQLNLCHRFVYHGRALCRARGPKCEECLLGLQGVCKAYKEFSK